MTIRLVAGTRRRDSESLYLRWNGIVEHNREFVASGGGRTQQRKFILTCNTTSTASSRLNAAETNGSHRCKFSSRRNAYNFNETSHQSSRYRYRYCKSLPHESRCRHQILLSCRIFRVNILCLVSLSKTTRYTSLSTFNSLECQSSCIDAKY